MDKLEVYVVTCALEDYSWVQGVALDIDKVIEIYDTVEADDWDNIHVYVEKFDAIGCGDHLEFNELEKEIFHQFANDNYGWKLLHSNTLINLGCIAPLED